jgi:hypothetical protein
MTDQKDKLFKFKKADFILFVVVIAIAALTMLFYAFYFNDSGSWVVVYQDGVEIERYAIEEDGIYTVNETNTFEIKNGVVDMIESECKNQICVNHLPIENVGETIVCLPNKIVVTIEGDGEENTLDAIVN